jgi:hypothetical protein
MRRMICLLALALCLAVPATAAAKTIVTEGRAQLTRDRSIEEVQKLALDKAKAQAGEAALSLISSRTEVRNGQLSSDQIRSVSAALVEYEETLVAGWFRAAAERVEMQLPPGADPAPGDEFAVRAVFRLRDVPDLSGFIRDTLAPDVVINMRTTYRAGEDILPEVTVKTAGYLVAALCAADPERTGADAFSLCRVFFPGAASQAHNWIDPGVHTLPSSPRWRLYGDSGDTLAVVVVWSPAQFPELSGVNFAREAQTGGRGVTAAFRRILQRYDAAGLPVYQKQIGVE